MNRAELNHPLILVANQEINQLKQIIPLLEKVKKTNRPLFIIAKDISNNVISNLIFNHIKGIIDVIFHIYMYMIPFN